jgi:hypothetical protein
MIMRFRPLNRHDAWRAMPQTLLMRGLGVTILAACGLAWPDLVLTMTLVDIGIICIMFAIVDLIVAAAIRRESACSARKIGALGLLGAGGGSVMIAMTLLPATGALALVMVWLVVSGGAVALWGGSFPRRSRSSGMIAQFGAGQFLLAFALAVVYPERASSLLHAALLYAVTLGSAQIALSMSLRRDKARKEATAADILTETPSLSS